MTRVPGPGGRLVFLPHAGGSVGFFRPMAAALSGRVEVLGVQYPGRQERFTEPVHTSIAELADGVTAALEPWAGDAPLALFGHSMGAMVAFEVALRLEHAGRPPRWLFASGRRAPSRRREEGLHRLGDRELVAELHRLEGTDSSILDDPELLEIVLPAYRGDLTAAETYPGSTARVSCPTTVLGGAADPQTTTDELQTWAAHTRGPCEVLVLPGGHFYLVSATDEVTGIIAARVAQPPAAPNQ